MEKYIGKTVSPGFAVGKLFFFKARMEDYADETTADVERELKFLSRCTEIVAEKLQMRMHIFEKEGRKDEAQLTMAHNLILNDISFQDKCKKRIVEDRATARRAVSETGREICAKFENMTDEYMRERSQDVRGVVEMLLQILGGERQEFPKLEEPVIIVADELIPEAALSFEKEKILGIIIKNGTEYSHSAYLARHWNVPALVGICPKEEWAGVLGAVNGETAEFFVEPTREICQYIMDKKENSKEY